MMLPRAMLAVLLALGATLAHAEPLTGYVTLTLSNALGRAADDVQDFHLQFAVQDDKWPKHGWGYATWFARGHSRLTITEAKVDGDEVQLKLDVDIVGDRWSAGGHGAYTVTVKRQGDRFAGSYRGSFQLDGSRGFNFQPQPRGEKKPKKPDPRLKELPPGLRDALQGKSKDAPKPENPDATTIDVEGAVTGRVEAPWPGKVERFKPLTPGEHPRLAFRAHEVALMKKRAAETPEGQAIMAQARKVYQQAGHSENDKFTTWPAVGMAFMYQMTGEQKYADEARDNVARTLLGNIRGAGIRQDIHHGPRLQALALAYDMAAPGWDEDFRLLVVDEIEQRVNELATGMFMGRGMGGFNPNPWSNHNGIRMGCMALGAMAIHGDRNSAGETLDMSRYIEIAAREVRMYYERGVGISGYGMEGAFYKIMTMQRGLLHSLHAFENVMGWDVVRGPIGDFDLVGYFLEAPPGKTPGLDPVVWAVDMITVPDDMLPGVLWLHHHSVGLGGNKTFAVDHGMLAPFVMARYPFDVEPKHPSESFRWIAPDVNKGHFIVRPTWKDGDDILLVMNLLSDTLRGCHYERIGPHLHHELHGFGTQWLHGQYMVQVTPKPDARNIHHGASITGYREPADRVAVLDMDVSRAYLQEIPKHFRKDAAKLAAHAKRENATVRDLPSFAPMLDYGITAQRHMLIDCSGESGAPLLIALVDRVQAPDALAAKHRAAATQEKKKKESKPLPPGLREKLGLKEGDVNKRSSGPAGLTSWRLPLSGKAGKVEIDGNRFTIDAGNATMTGVLAAPQTFDSSRSLTAYSDGDYFAVFTLQRGKAPEIKVSGEGLDAVVTVGKRTIRFDGKTLTLE